MTTDDFSVDDIIPGQEWCCISYILPNEENEQIGGVKIRGSFPRKEQAEKHGLELFEADDRFHIYIGHVGHWLPLTKRSMAKKVRYPADENKNLDLLMTGYFEAQKQANREFERYKAASREAKQTSDEENPVSVLNRLRVIQKQMDDLTHRLAEVQQQWNSYTEEQRRATEAEYQQAIAPLSSDHS